MKVLIVEDDRVLAKIMEEMFAEESRIHCLSVTTLHEAILAAKTMKPDLAILDFGLPDSTADNTITKGIPAIKKAAPDVAIAGYSGLLDEHRKQAALEAGADAVSEKGSTSHNKTRLLNTIMEAFQCKGTSCEPYIKLIEGMLGTNL